MNRPLLAVLIACLALAGCKVLQVEKASVVSDDDWLTEGDSPQRRHAIAERLAPPLVEAWVYNAGAGFGHGSPLVLGNTVLVGTRKGEIHAIDLETGRRQGMDNFGDAIEGTPVIREGVLYVPIAWGRRALHAYDLGRASTRWRVKHTPIEAGLLALDNGVLGVDMHATVRAYAADDGSVLWERPLGDRAAVQASPVLAAGRVIVANDQGEVVALHPSDGTLDWTHALDAPVYTSMTADEASVYLPTTRGRLVCLDAATGRERWHVALPDTTIRFAAAAVDGGLLVVGATDSFVRAFDAETGTLRWSYEALDALTAAPLLTADHVYIGTMGHELVALDRETGEMRWQYTLRGRVKSAMAGHDGRLIVLSEPRYVYLFEPAENQDHVATR